MSNRLEALFSTNVVGIAFCSQESNWITANSKLCALLGYQIDELRGRSWLDFTDHTDRELEISRLISLRRGDINGYGLKKDMMCRDGSKISVDFSVEAIRTTSGDIDYFRVIVQEIQLSSSILRRLLLAGDIVANAAHGIIVANAMAQIVDVNKAFTTITKYLKANVVGKTPAILKSGKHGQEFYTQMWDELNAKDYWSGEICNRRKDGTHYVERLEISVIRDKDGILTNYIGMFSDITDQAALQKELELSASYDSLTNLPNRALMMKRLQEAVEHADHWGQQLVVVFLDLDGFKNVNDLYGHDVGDALLMAIAGRLKMVVREGDTVARLGGDEFVIIAKDLGDLEAIGDVFLKRIIASVAKPLQIGKYLLSISASLGVSFYTNGDRTGPDQLLRQSDQSMYRAKLAGKNSFHIYDGYDESIMSRLHKEMDEIKVGFRKKQFVVHYQPKVNMRTGDILGAEALVRWNHPDKGLLTPAFFLPAIENDPMIAEIGEWVIDEVLKQLCEWNNAASHYSTSINVSAYQLQQPDFVARLKVSLKMYPDVIPEQLKLEVLETSALRDLNDVAAIIGECQSFGVDFALDDFGTGYSSLKYLKHLPANELKIDKSFVQGMLDDPDDLAIVEGVIGLARAFRRSVVAEGVETAEHGAWLLRLGCDVAQGYGIGRPMSADQFDEWASAWLPAKEWTTQETISRDRMPLLFASVEHRAWVSSIDRFVRGEPSLIPDLGEESCRFGKWLQSEGARRFRVLPAFAEIESIHSEVHSTVHALMNHKSVGDHEAASDAMKAMFQLQDSLVGKLLALSSDALYVIKKEPTAFDADMDD